MLEANRDVQVGVFLSNHLHWITLQQSTLETPFSLGLSLGEYNHLVHIGALSFEDALRLVDARGAIYEQGPRGAMAAVFPLSLREVSSVVERARPYGAIEIALYNSPTQHVLAGEHPAMDAALRILEDEFFLQGRIIEKDIPVHSAVFAPAARAFREVLQRTPWRKPHSPYLPNLTATPLEDPNPEDFIEILTQHVHRPVLWMRSIEAIIGRFGPEALLLEVGPGRVLTDLSRRWAPCPSHSTENQASLSLALSACGISPV
jgi:[acyl-carrier-protein] S-malonyltransferase